MGIIPIFICIVLVGIDQFTKYLAVTHLRPVGSIPLIENIFSLTFVENRGAAFGFMQGARWFFVVVTVIAVVGIVIYYVKLPKGKVFSWVRVSMILILAGAIGNFIDRLTKGYVVDFLHATFINFPVFNIADVYLVCGTALFIIMFVFFVKEDEVA